MTDLTGLQTINEEVSGALKPGADVTSYDLSLKDETAKSNVRSKKKEKKAVTEPTLRITQHCDPQSSSDSSDEEADSEEETSKANAHQWEEMKQYIKDMHDTKSNASMQHDNMEGYVNSMIEFIPLDTENGLYNIKACLVTNDQQPFCPIELEITNEELLLLEHC